VELESGAVFRAGIPKTLFQSPPLFLPSQAFYRSAIFTWDVAADGKRFLALAPAAESSPSPFAVILNWTSLLNK
jgi:hypothetical protein